MKKTSRGLIVIFTDKTSTRQIEEVVAGLQEDDTVALIGFFPEDIEEMKEKYVKITKDEAFLKRFWHRLKGKP